MPIDFNSYLKGDSDRNRLGWANLQERIRNNDERAVIREERMKLMEEQQYAKQTNEYIKLKTQREQAKQVAEANALLARANPNSIHFSKIELLARTKFPLAFNEPKNPGDVSALGSLLALKKQHDSVMGIGINHAKRLGMPIDETNPGYNPKTGTIDWGVAEAKHSEFLSARAGQLGLKPSAMNPTGEVSYNDDAQIQAANQQAIDDRAKASEASTTQNNLFKHQSKLHSHLVRLKEKRAEMLGKKTAALGEENTSLAEGYALHVNELESQINDLEDILGVKKGGPKSVLTEAHSSTAQPSEVSTGKVQLPGQPSSNGQPKSLDEATAKSILQQAGGDAEKARKLAREQGYNF